MRDHAKDTTHLGTDPTKARVICSLCPVRQECLNYARADVDTVGVWGGATQQERRKLRGVA